MATRVRSFSKINLGLAIGPVRADGFHALTTLYQTLALHDVVTVTARLADSGSSTRISLTTNHAHVPVDGRNTAWKMVERCLVRLGVAAEVAIHIEKNLPVQGGLGAGSANAAAALLGLERELGMALDGAARLELAADVGSDVPLFLLGGAVLGLGRGEVVSPLPELPSVPCVIAVPTIGVSTPRAFRDWDAKAGQSKEEVANREREWRRPDSGDCVVQQTRTSLTSSGNVDRLKQLSLVYASAFAPLGDVEAVVEPGTSGIIRDILSFGDLEKKQGSSDPDSGDQDKTLNSLAENALLALVRTGIGSGLQNDFEEVVFPQYPSLRETKRFLMGSDSGNAALYAALSGSGSALFGLYRSTADARAAQHRVQASGVRALLTATLPRSDYWRRMLAG